MDNFLKRFGLLFLCIAFFAAPLISSFYKYYYAKDYTFIVEAECDPEKEVCFSRDCTNPDDCPPNGLSIYKEFYLKADDFSKCSDNSCLQECLTGVVECEKIECDESAGDTCTAQI